MIAKEQAKLDSVWIGERWDSSRSTTVISRPFSERWDKPEWLNEKKYREKIQPRLAGITVPTIVSALAVSEPYATNIRAGKCVPHPRHWLALARLVSLSLEE